MLVSTLLKNGGYDEALEECNKLINIDDNNADYYYTRGIIYTKMERLSESISDYSKALEINPKHANAAYSRGSCYNQLVISLYRETSKKRYPIIIWG